MNSKGKNIIIILLIVIIIVLSIFIGLLLTNTISIGKKDNTNINKVEKKKSDSDSDTNKSSMINQTLPSGQVISVNRAFKGLFNDNQKIKFTTLSSDKNMTDSNFEELTLSELLAHEKSIWQQNSYVTNCPTDSYSDKEISVSNTNFDLDNDGINEIMFSFCETFILLHYYDDNIYGYVLGGYRTNGNWTVSGKAYHSGSYIDYGYTKYTFNKDKLQSENIAESERDYSETITTEEKVNYTVEGKSVTKETFDSYMENVDKEEKIEYVGYSAN